MLFTFSFFYCSPTLSNIPCNPRGAIIHGTVDIRHRVMTDCPLRFDAPKMEAFFFLLLLLIKKTNP